MLPSLLLLGLLRTNFSVENIKKRKRIFFVHVSEHRCDDRSQDNPHELWLKKKLNRNLQETSLDGKFVTWIVRFEIIRKAFPTCRRFSRKFHKRGVGNMLFIVKTFSKVIAHACKKAFIKRELVLFNIPISNNYLKTKYKSSTKIVSLFFFSSFHETFIQL